VGLFVNFTDAKKTVVGAAGDELAFTYTIAAAGSVMLEIHLTPAAALGM